MPMDMNPMPMDDNSMDMSNNQMGMDNGQMNDMNMEQDFNPYDTNFDAGVEANEEEDPKKFIEQLSGKLSQSLRSYQQGLPQPDADTAKYAAGMVVKAAIDGLSPKDVKDILNKLNNEDENESDDEIDDNNEESQPMEFDGLESKNRHNELIDEIFQNLTQKDCEEIPNQQRDMKKSYRKKPFTAPNLK